MKFSAEMIAAALGGDIVGNKDVTVRTLAKIEEGEEGALSFLSNPKYEQYLYSTRSSIVIVARTFEPKQEVEHATLVKVDDPYGCFAKLLEMYVASKPQKSGVHPTAVIDPTATVGEGSYIGAYVVVDAGAKVGSGCKIYPHCYIGDRATIGDNTMLYSGVKVYEECKIGNRVIVHSGAVIGSDGFGFAPNAEGKYDKIPQIGNVVVEDDVEIGANTTIDRATMGSTRICKGVKLDNLIQIAHNVVVGENTVAAAMTGIAGSTKVGRNCMFGGQTGIVGHITIGDRVNTGSQTGVTNSQPDDVTLMGFPGMPIAKYRRCNAVYRNLPEMKKTVDKLEKMFLSEEK